MRSNLEFGMPPHHHDGHEKVRVAGKITDIFAHRFVVQTASEKVLADLTPHGMDMIKLEIGDAIEIEGEQKPSEIKVLKIERAGESFVIAHPKHAGPHHPAKHHHHDADPQTAKEAAAKAGYSIIGEPRRKPKHFEILGKKGRSFQELHIEIGGTLYKEKPVSADDHKWHAEIAGARAT